MSQTTWGETCKDLDTTHDSIFVLVSSSVFKDPMPVDDCSSPSCQNNPSCLDRCIEKDLSGTENLLNEDCSSQSCLNNPSCLDKCLTDVDDLSFYENKYNAVLNFTGSNILAVESMDTELKILNEIKGIKQAHEMETKNIKENIDELKTVLSEISMWY